MNWCAPHKESVLTELWIKDSKGNKKPSVKKIDRVTSQKPITMTGFAVWAGVHKDTIFSVYANKKRYSDSIKRLRDACEAYAELLTLDPTNRNATGVIFNLKNNFGWKDKSELESHNTGELKINIQKNYPVEGGSNGDSKSD